MDTNPKLTAQVSSIVGKVIRECIMAFARTPVGSSSSCGQQAGGYLCRDMGGDMKYMLAFQNPRVRVLAVCVPPMMSVIQRSCHLLYEHLVRQHVVCIGLSQRTCVPVAVLAGCLGVVSAGPGGVVVAGLASFIAGQASKEQ